MVKGENKMDLNVNSPSYYTQEFGVDDDIYRMCRELFYAFKEKKYSDVINIIGIVPIIAPTSVIEKGLCKEHKRCETKYGFASISMYIDYDEYVKSDISDKKKLLVDNILKFVKSISKKGKVDYVLFENDMRVFCIEHNIII